MSDDALHVYTRPRWMDRLKNPEQPEGGKYQVKSFQFGKLVNSGL